MFVKDLLRRVGAVVIALAMLGGGVAQANICPCPQQHAHASASPMHSAMSDCMKKMAKPSTPKKAPSRSSCMLDSCCTASHNLAVGGADAGVPIAYEPHNLVPAISILGSPGIHAPPALPPPISAI